MSRSFAASTDLITQGSAAIPTTGSLSFWLYPTWAYNDGANHGFFDVFNSAGGTFLFRLEKNDVDSKFFCGWYNNGTDTRVVVLASGLLQNSWNHICLTWTSGGTTTLYLNGTSIGTAGSTSTWSTAGTSRIVGNYTSGGHSTNDRIAEVGLWNVALSSSDVTNLYNSGANAKLPSEVQNGNLVDDLPLWGISSPEPNLVSSGTTGTLTGTSQGATHAPVDLYVVQIPAIASALAATSLSKSFAATPTVNNAVVVKVWGSLVGTNLAGDITVSDNQSNTYSVAVFKQDTTANGEFYAEFLGKAATASGTFTVTVTSSVSLTAVDMIIEEWYPTLYVDQTASATGSSASPAPGSVTTLQAPEMCSTGFALQIGVGTNTPTVPSGYVLSGQDTNTANGAGASAYKTVGVTGAQNPTWTITSAVWTSCQVTYTLVAPGFLAPEPVVVNQAVKAAVYY